MHVDVDSYVFEEASAYVLVYVCVFGTCIGVGSGIYTYPHVDMHLSCFDVRCLHLCMYIGMEVKVMSKPSTVFFTFLAVILAAEHLYKCFSAQW